MWDPPSCKRKMPCAWDSILFIVRAPASASRLQLTEGGLLKYLAKASLTNDRCDTLFEPAGQILDLLEWIAKVTSHIPEKGAQLVHYYGAYPNAHRGKRAKLGDSAGATRRRKQEGESESEWIQLRRKAWTALIRLVYEADPLVLESPLMRTQSLPTHARREFLNPVRRS
jgi:hypothetical protein